MEKMSNYEIQRRQWQERFLSMDQEALCRRLPGLELAESQLRLRHFGRLFAVSRRDGTIRCLTDGAPASYNEAMNIYTLLHYARPDARWTGRWLPFRDLRHASPFASAYHSGIIRPLARTFAGREDLLPGAVRELGGLRLDLHGYQLPAFECIPMRLYFWDGDEDFGAQANLLFDESAVDFIHVESVVTIASVGVFRLAEAAGLSPDGNAL